MLHLYRSNRTEVLVDQLAELLSTTPLDPMTEEVVGVQGRGIERWLSSELAGRLSGIGHTAFPFPRRVVHDILNLTLGTRAAHLNAWEPPQLVWHILTVLPDLLPRPEFEPIRQYLGAHLGERVDHRALILAQKIAETLDRYFTYRPDWVTLWLDPEEPDGDWQSILLRTLRAHVGHPTLPELLSESTEQLKTLDRVPGLWPRLSLFAVSTLPPAFVRLFAQLPESHPVHIFTLSPSPHYWDDLIDPHRTHGEARADKAGAHLLTSLGKVAGEFAQVLETHAPRTGRVDHAEFRYPGTGSLLSALQSDLYHVDTDESPTPADDSVQVHSCYGPIRQVEALRDLLARAFSEIPKLQPRDVIVMTPNIEAYAPLVDATFSDSAADGLGVIPVRIADRHEAHKNEVAELLLRILELTSDRITQEDLSDLLQRGVIQRRFRLTEEQADAGHRWWATAGMRWGLNGAHREAQGVQPSERFTARGALDRILLGHAMRGNEERLFQGMLTYEDADNPDVVEGLAAFYRALETSVLELSRCQTLSAFASAVETAMDALTEPPSSAHWQTQSVRNVLADLLAAAGDHETPLEPRAFAALFAEPLRRTRSFDFASGAVTVAAMVPMRAVPYRVVCLLGLDESAFPARATPVGFDKTAQEPRPGDRQREDDDRQLFLEALLSARDRFIVLYTGRRPADNQPLPVSVATAELLEAVERHTGNDQSLIREQPLQPYAPRAFTEDAIRSYDARRIHAARAIISEPGPVAPFVEANNDGKAPASVDASGRPIPPVRMTSVTVDELARFFRDPAKAYFRQRLETRLDRRDESYPSEDPLDLDPLENWQLHDAVLTLKRKDADAETVRRSLLARGLVADHAGGQAQIQDALERFESGAWGALLRDLSKASPLLPVLVGLDLAGVRVEGRVDEMFETGAFAPKTEARSRVVVTWAKHKPERAMEEWVRHVLLAVHFPETPLTTVLVERDAKTSMPFIQIFAPPPRAGTAARNLVYMWQDGLSAALPFHPAAAARYRDAEIQQSRWTPEQSAWSAWSKKDGPAEEIHTARVFGELGPELLSAEFAWPTLGRFPKLTRHLWNPLAEAAQRAHRLGDES